MKPHRVKHIPTGLYYKPYGNNSNLSLVGKLYVNNSDPFNVNNGDDSIYIAIRKSHSILKKFPWSVLVAIVSILVIVETSLT